MYLRVKSLSKKAVHRFCQFYFFQICIWIQIEFLNDGSFHPLKYENHNFFWLILVDMLALLPFLAFLAFAQATNYYASSVNPSRSDSNAGTDPNYPWASLTPVGASFSLTSSPALVNDWLSRWITSTGEQVFTQAMWYTLRVIAYNYERVDCRLNLFLRRL